MKGLARILFAPTLGSEKNAPQKPCEAPCPKCGSRDIHRMFFEAGQKTEPTWLRSLPIKSSEWVDRDDLDFPAKKDCIVHRCHCCSFSWDSDPLLETEKAEQ